jgi:HTH-type transcriptional regulator/antitoxin HigA
VLNICGNQYRLVVKINYLRQWVFIRFIGCQHNLNDMNLKVIKSEKEYDQALERLDVVFDAPPDTPEGDEAELLMILIEKYEDENYPIEAPDPIEAIKFRMEQMNMKNKDLATILGYKSRVTEILKRRRKLTLKMIRNLHEKLNIPYESLIQDYQSNPPEKLRG